MKKLFTILLTFMFMFSSYSVFTSPVQASVNAESDVCISFDKSTDMKPKYDVEKNKSWCIKFAAEIDSSSVNEESVYVLGYRNKKAPVKLSVKGTNITVTPVKNYELGEKYFLIVENIKTTDGKEILGRVSMEFNIKEDSNVVVHDIPTIKVKKYENPRGYYNDHEVGSCQNIKLKRPLNSTYKQDLFIINWQIGNRSRKFNKDGSLTFAALEDRHVSDGQVGLSFHRTEKNEPMVCCWDWSVTPRVTYARRIEHMNLALELFKYYARNPKDGEAIWDYIDEHVKAQENMCTEKVEKFGETKVKFVDPGHFGINVIFLNTGDPVNTEEMKKRKKRAEILKYDPANISIFELYDKSKALRKEEEKEEEKRQYIGGYSFNESLDEESIGDVTFFEDAEYFYDDGACVKYNGKYGIINTEGEWVIEPKFDSPDDFKDKRKKYNYDYNAMYYKEHQERVEKYNKEKEKQNNKTKAEDYLKPSNEDGKYGFINKKGEWVIKPQFEYDYYKDYTNEFNDNGLAYVKLNGNYCVINKKGEQIIEPKLRRIVNNIDGFKIVVVGSRYGVLDKNAKFILEPEFQMIEGFPYDKKQAENPEGKEIYKLSRIKKDYKYGFVNREFKVAIKPQFDYVYEFENGLAKVVFNGKFGYINEKGDYVVKPKFDRIGEFKDGKTWAQFNGKYGFIDTKGNWIIEPKFGDASNFDGDLAAVAVDGMYGFINEKGDIVIEPKFDWFESFEAGIPCIAINEKYGVIARDGTVLLDCILSDKPSVQNIIEYKWDSKGREKIPVENLISLKIGDKSVLLNKEGKPIFNNVAFDSIGGLQKGYILVKINDGKYAFMDKDCKFFKIKD